MKKVFLFIVTLLFMFAFFPQTHSSFAEQSFCKIISNTAPVLSSASSAGEVLFVAKHKACFNLKNETPIYDGDIAFIELDISEHSSAFVRYDQIAINPRLSISINISSNARVEKNISVLKLYQNNNHNYEYFCEITVNESTPIRLIEGYDENYQYSKIQVLVGGENLELYAKTNELDPFGLNKTEKIALGLASSCLIGISTFFIGFFIKKKKQNKNKLA